ARRLLPAGPLTLLARVPAEAAMATSLRLDLEVAIDGLEELLRVTVPEIHAHFLAAMEPRVAPDFDPRADLIAPLGAEGCSFSGPAEGAEEYESDGVQAEVRARLAARGLDSRGALLFALDDARTLERGIAGLLRHAGMHAVTRHEDFQGIRV